MQHSHKMELSNIKELWYMQQYGWISKYAEWKKLYTKEHICMITFIWYKTGKINRQWKTRILVISRGEE